MCGSWFVYSPSGEGTGELLRFLARENLFLFFVFLTAFLSLLFLHSH